MKSNRKFFAASLAPGGSPTAGGGFWIAIPADTVPAAAPAAPAAAGPHPGWHHHRHHGGGMMLSKLNLSAEQQASVKTIMANAAPQMKSIFQEMHANSQKLH